MTCVVFGGLAGSARRSDDDILGYDERGLPRRVFSPFRLSRVEIFIVPKMGA